MHFLYETPEERILEKAAFDLSGRERFWARDFQMEVSDFHAALERGQANGWYLVTDDLYASEVIVLQKGYRHLIETLPLPENSLLAKMIQEEKANFSDSLRIHLSVIDCASRLIRGEEMVLRMAAVPTQWGSGTVSPHEYERYGRDACRFLLSLAKEKEPCWEELFGSFPSALARGFLYGCIDKWDVFYAAPPKALREEFIGTSWDKNEKERLREWLAMHQDFLIDGRADVASQSLPEDAPLRTFFDAFQIAGNSVGRIAGSSSEAVAAANDTDAGDESQAQVTSKEEVDEHNEGEEGEETAQMPESAAAPVRPVGARLQQNAGTIAMRRALAVMCQRKRAFDDAFLNWCFAAVLMSNASHPDNMRHLQYMAHLNRIAEDDKATAAWLLAKFGVNEDPTEQLMARLRLWRRDRPTFAKALVVLTAKKLDLYDDFEPVMMKAVRLAVDGSRFFALEWADACGDVETVEKLSAELGRRPLLSGFRPMPRWEKFLDRVIERSGVKVSGPGLRVAYIYDDDRHAFELRVQRTKNGTVWTQGTQLSPKNFMKRLREFSPLEAAIARLDTHMEYLSDFSAVNERLMFDALCGAPAVFRKKMPAVPIEIRRVPLQLVVTLKNGRYVVDTNLSPDFDPWNVPAIDVRHQADGSVEVTRLSDDDLALLKDLSRVKDFPPEAKPKLTQCLALISKKTPVMSDLLQNASGLKKRKGESRITMRLQRSGPSTFTANALVRPLPEGALAAVPGSGLKFLAAASGRETVQVERDLEAEKRHFEAVLEALEPLNESREDETHWTLSPSGCLMMLERLRELKTHAEIEWPEGEAFSVTRPTITLDALNLSLSSLGSWFEVEGEVRLDEKTVLSVSELLEKLRTAEGNFIRLGDKEYVALTDELKRQLMLLDSAATAAGKNKLRVSRFSAGVLESLEEEGLSFNADEAFYAFLKRIRAADETVPEVPEGLRAELRGYQLEGFRWLARLASWGAGALLADDMGLGKTIQTIALLLSRKEKGPALVVVPTAVLFNWVEELKRFAPGLNPIIFNLEDRTHATAKAGPGDVMLVTYGVMSSEIDNIASRTWSTIVLDEAHSIKNRMTKASKAAMSLKGDARVLLTGTPIQNHLSEIWTLFEFANPGLLGGFSSFTERFIIPVERDKNREQQRLLKRLITPFILRRTKNEVLEELPEKTEITLRVELSKEERALYEKLREEAAFDIASGAVNPIEALAHLTKLRLAACHPALVNAKLHLDSSKTNAFLELVEELREGRHRALVFSQFTSHLALIREALDRRKIPYLYLDGSMSPGERTKRVKAFQEGSMPLFLISLKAGGTGLNLTAADYVIHLDPWWNPAIEDQASDRAYRIGQEQPVTIYRLIAENTIEEKILRLHATKKSLADALLEGADVSSRLSREEILKLLAA